MRFDPAKKESEVVLTKSGYDANLNFKVNTRPKTKVQKII